MRFQNMAGFKPCDAVSNGAQSLDIATPVHTCVDYVEYVERNCFLWKCAMQIHQETTI